MIDALNFAAVSTVLFAGLLSLVALRPVFVADHPRAVLILLGLISLAALAALIRPDPLGLRVGLDPSSAPLLPGDRVGQEVYRDALLDFGTDDVYVVAMQTEDVFTSSALATLRRVTDRIRRLPGVRGAESLTNTSEFRWDAQREMIEVGDLIDEQLPQSQAQLQELRERVLADRLYTKTLVSRDGRNAAINVVFRPMSDGDFVASGLDADIARIVEEEARVEQRFYIAGGPHMRAEGHRLMVGDLLRLIPIAVLLASLVLWIVTGSKRGVLLPLGSCLTATLWTFAAMAVVGAPLNVITIVLGPTLICVGCVYGVHVLARYDDGVAGAASPRAAALACLEYTRTPVLLAGLTTCAGFAALWLTDTRATRELGVFAVFGVASVTLLSLTGVPALLALVPIDRDAARDGGRTRTSRAFARNVDRGLGLLGRALTERAGAGVALWGVLSICAALALPYIVIDTDFMTFFHPESRVRGDFAAVNELLVGAVPIYVTFEGNESGAFREPEAMRALERVQEALMEVAGVSQVLSVVDLVKTANRALGEGKPEAERIPETRPGIAEVLFMIPKSRTRRFSTSNHSAANLVVRTGRMGSAAIRELERGISKVLAAENLPPGIRSAVTGNAILLNRSADSIAGRQILQVSVVTFAIWLLVLYVFGSQRLALLAIAPNIVPVLLFFGVLGAGAAPLSLPTSLIGSIALGIAVDDTVHFLVAYRRLREAGNSPEEAAIDCIRRVGRPIIITSIVLVVGFLVLWPSGFVTLREFGALCAMTMGICLITDLTLLPALLVKARV
ncbi:MAG: MMPL family transporter [bacterium]|nr:MMPL family transporter [bacterium]